jgi:L-gulonate 5-dehydrogenase
MRAVIFDAPRTARSAEVGEPRPGPGEVLVRTRLAGLCGSDMHAYLGTQPFFVYPQIPGHEVIGEVVAGGEGVGLGAGRRVVLDPTINCGVCRACRLGRYNCCATIRVIGVHAPGVLAEAFVAPARRLHPIADNVPDEVAVLAEPLSIGFHAADRAEVQADDQVAIIGAGAIGLALVLMVRARGGRCLVIDREQSRLDLARSMGAEVAINVSAMDPVAAVREWTEGEGVARTFEAVGTPQTIRAAAEMTATAGRMVILGLCQKDVALPPSMFIRKELEVVGSRLHQNTVEKVVAMLERSEIDPRGMLTEIRPLDEYQSALDDLEHRPGEFVKIALKLGTGTDLHRIDDISSTWCK